MQVITPDRVVFSGDVQMVSLRGGDGDLGILPRHAPLVTTVKPGLVKVKVAEGEDYIHVTGGFLEVLPTRITILADAAELSWQIDVERAQRAKERAEARLSQRGEDVDVARAEAALQRAENRLRAAALAKEHGSVLRKYVDDGGEES